QDASRTVYFDPLRYPYVFLFSDTARPELYTLSLHDALPILRRSISCCASPSSNGNISASSSRRARATSARARQSSVSAPSRKGRSEEHTSELQSPYDLVCRLLLEKKKKTWYDDAPKTPKHNR